MPLNPLIVLANYYQFKSSDTLSFACIESRFFLFCESGKGELTIKNKRYAIEQGDFFIIPWGYSITYKSDKVSPLLLGGIHIIPDAKENSDLFFYDVAHSNKSKLSGAPFRKNSTLQNLENIFVGQFSRYPTLYHLATYIIASFTREEPKEILMRNLAKLLIDEWVTIASTSLSISHHNNKELNKILLYIDKNYHRQIEIKELVDILDTSISTLTRLFKKNLSLSPIQYINQTKIKKAQTMLSQTNLTISTISKKIGIEDQFYFSKLFKNVTGSTPLAYRKKYSILFSAR